MSIAINKVLILLLLSMYSLSVVRANNVIDFSMADQYIKEGKHNKARWIYINAIDKKTHVLEAHLGLANLSYKKRKYNSALASINKVLSLDINHTEARLMRCYIYVYQEEWSKAFDELETLKQLDSDNPEIYALLDGVYAELGDHEASMKALNTYKQKGGR